MRTKNERLDVFPTTVLGRSQDAPTVKDLATECQRNLKILKSYKALSEKIPDSITEKLIERGMSKNHERICLKCFNLMPDEGVWRCPKCRKEAAKTASKGRKAYYQANKDKFNKKKVLKNNL